MLPQRKRKVRFIAWIKVSLSFIARILEDLFVFWESTLTEAQMTPQICYIEKYLNDRYGTNGAIYIGDGYLLGPWVWYKNLPTGELDFFMSEPDNYCYYTSAVAQVDFVVMVPRLLSDETSMIAAIVQKFKLGGMAFIIQLY